MFRIKICGVTTLADAQLVADAGADAIGFNFYTGSKRRVAPAVAAEIAAELPKSVSRVGVFVNASCSQILDVADQVDLDFIQLHGDEPPAFLDQLRECELGQRELVRAFRCRDGLSSVQAYLDQCAIRPEAVLLDAFDEQQYGGTGQRLDWQRVIAEKPLLGETPLVLAGGLRPGNVAEAIRQIRPAAVDTASGVESAPGRKDAGLVAEFVAAATTAFAG